MGKTNAGLVLADLTTIPQRLGEFKWKKLGEGVEICPLLQDADGHDKIALLRYAPGASVPEHLHTGMEYIQILAGFQQDDHGTYHANTMLINRPGTRHKITSPEGCVALAIWESPVRFV